MDGDLQHPPEYTKFLAKILKNGSCCRSRNLLVKKGPGLVY